MPRAQGDNARVHAAYLESCCQISRRPLEARLNNNPALAHPGINQLRGWHSQPRRRGSMCCGRLQAWLAPRGGVPQHGLDPAGGGRLALPGASAAPRGELGARSRSTNTCCSGGAAAIALSTLPAPRRGQGFVPERTGIPVSRAINSAPAPAASADLWLLQLILPRCEPFITSSPRYPAPPSHPGGLEEF